MKKPSVCILFGGVSTEHARSVRAAQSVLCHINHEKYHVFPVGITEDGDWLLYGGKDYAELTDGTWQENPLNVRAAISPIRGQGLLRFEGDCVVRERIDVVFPVMYGEKCQDGTVQGLLQMSGIPWVGSAIAASAVSMDKTLTKLVMEHIGIPQAAWQTVRSAELEHRMGHIVDILEKKISYPMYVKPANGNSFEFCGKAENREQLRNALTVAATGGKVLVEEFVAGREIEVAIMGNDNPVASVCGEVDYGGSPSDCTVRRTEEDAVVFVPARISEEVEEEVREIAVKVYNALGCRGLSRLDFFVTNEDGCIIFRDISTMPDFAGLSMYQKMFAASGISYTQLIDELLQLAMEDRK